MMYNTVWAGIDDMGKTTMCWRHIRHAHPAFFIASHSRARTAVLLGSRFLGHAFLMEAVHSET